jgi:hypothetical protein
MPAITKDVGGFSFAFAKRAAKRVIIPGAAAATRMGTFYLVYVFHHCCPN